nr:MBL fold metallo-hydrolase [Guyparkeria halophila]
MLFEAFEESGLSHLSYAVGCQQSKELAIVDPRRDIDLYLDFAEQEGYVIRHVLDTHIHADYASGARELAEVTGAKLHLSAYDDNEVFEVGFDHLPMQEGDSVQMGNVRIEALHTPGHTPEHLTFLVYDGARSTDVPAVALTGDFLFVGSLGPPGPPGRGGHPRAGQAGIPQRAREAPRPARRPGDPPGARRGLGLRRRHVRAHRLDAGVTSAPPTRCSTRRSRKTSSSTRCSATCRRRRTSTRATRSPTPRGPSRCRAWST